MNRLTAPLLSLLLCSAAVAGQAHVRVDGAWVRATAPGQPGTGGFMKLTANQATRLVGLSTPAAGVVQVHEMKMEGDVMKMRAVPALELPAGKTVELKPGGLHLMLMELKQPLRTGSWLPLTLTLRDARNQETRIEVRVPVSHNAPAAALIDGHKH